MTNKQKNIIAGISFILFSAVLATEGYFAYGNLFLNEIIANTKQVLTHMTEEPNTFSAPEITAGHAIVYDIKNSKILYEKNAYTVHPIASITKVVSALVSYELLNPDQQIMIDQNALAQDSDNGLLLNETWSFKNLLDFSLLVSSNDGAYAIANIAGALVDNGVDTEQREISHVDSFVGMMNKKMVEIGLRNTYFNNPSGLDEDLYESGGYSTAYELAKLFEYITQNNYQILEATTYKTVSLASENNIIHNATNTNIIQSDIPSLIASKTGYTDLAGGNLAIVFDVGVNHPVAIIVLDSTYDERFIDISSLVTETTKFFSK